MLPRFGSLRGACPEYFSPSTHRYSINEEQAMPDTILTTCGGVADWPRSVRYGGVRLITAGVVAWILGCADVARRVAPVGSPEGTAAVVRGDWNDLDAVVELAASVNEMAVVSTDWPVDSPESQRDYELVTAGDEPVRMTFVRKGASSGGIEMEARAKVGRFGDARREGRLLEAVRVRLRELEGVDSAPTRLR
jgi:hypothetical protein